MWILSLLSVAFDHKPEHNTFGCLTFKNTNLRNFITSLSDKHVPGFITITKMTSLEMWNSETYGGFQTLLNVGSTYSTVALLRVHVSKVSVLLRLSAVALTLNARSDQ